MSSVIVVTAAEEVAHVDVFLGLFLLLLLLLGGSITASSGGIASGGGGTSGANVGEDGGDILALEGAAEEAGPVTLNLVARGLDDLGELV